MRRRETPLPGWRNWVRWKGWRKLDSAHVLTSSQSRAERRLSWRLLGCQWLPHSTSQSELSKWSGPACFTPQCSTGSGADQTMVTKVTHSEEGPQVGSGTPGTTQINKSCPSTAANLPICAESTQVLARLQEWLYNRGGGAEAGGSDRR